MNVGGRLDPMEAPDFGSEDLNTSGAFLSFLAVVAQALTQQEARPDLSKRINATILTKRANGKDGVILPRV